MLSLKLAKVDYGYNEMEMRTVEKNRHKKLSCHQVCVERA